MYLVDIFATTLPFKPNTDPAGRGISSNDDDWGIDAIFFRRFALFVGKWLMISREPVLAMRFLELCRLFSEEGRTGGGCG